MLTMLTLTLLGFQATQTIMPSSKMATIPPLGELIWAEPFELPIGDDWFLDDLDANRSGFRQVFDSDAFDGEGSLVVRGMETASNNCTPKSKKLVTPPIPVGDWREIQITFKSKLTANTPRGTIASFSDFFRLSHAGPDGTTSKMDFGVPIVENLGNGWEQIVFLVNVSGFTGEAFPFTLNYVATREVCPTIRIDDFAVFGSNTVVPQTVIIEPRDLGGFRIVEIGETLEFGAVADPPDDSTVFRWVVIDTRDDKLVAEFQGQNIEITFDKPGPFAVLCFAANALGAEDPTPAVRLIEVGSNVGLDTRIIEPDPNKIKVPLGAAVDFKAEALGNSEVDTRILWTVFRDNADRVPLFFAEGESVVFTFDQPGRFSVFAIAEDANGFVDRSPAIRQVEVFEKRVAIVDPRPPGRLREILVPAGEPIRFRGVVEDPAGLIENFLWLRLPEEEPLCPNQAECEMVFPDKGTFGVALVALNGEDVVDNDFLAVFVEPPLYGQIVSPNDRQRIAVEQPFRLFAEVSGTALQGADLFWLVGDQVLPGQEVIIENGISRPGNYQAIFNMRNRELDQVFQRKVNFKVFDPDTPPRPEIIQPRTNRSIGTGDTVFFEAGLHNVPLDSVTPYWEIVDLATDDILSSASGRVLGRVAFPNAGSFEARLFLRGDQGDLLVDTRTIEVGTVDAAAFSGNETPENAAAINAGRYEGLSLDRNHYFELNLPADGLTVDMSLVLPVAAKLIIAPTETNQIFEREILGGKSFQLTGLPAGNYRIGVVPIQPVKKKVDFSFEVSVLNPSLYFPDVADDRNRETVIGIVNTTNEDADIEIIAYDADGNILDSYNQVLSGQGTFTDSTASLFSDVASELSWIRADSTHALVGYSRTVATDDLEAYGVSAAKSLRSELFIPHIAKATETWSTRANVVNGKPEQAAPMLLAGVEEISLDNGPSYTKDAFSFQDKLTQPISDESSWGSMIDNDVEARLAGNEVFGKVDGTRQIVGLGLSGLPEDNANFTSSANVLYFAHVANIEQFWTGISLVNTSDANQALLIRAFGESGAEIGQKVLDLLPREKRVELADTLLADFGDVSSITWFQVEADRGIVGYELFGTYDVKQMAGIEAITETNDELCFPFVDTSGKSWHGIALVNVSDQPANLTFELRDSQGNVIKTVMAESTLLGKEKSIFLLSTLFEGLPEAATWLKVTADQQLAGFQLFGNNKFDHMSGLIAQ